MTTLSALFPKARAEILRQLFDKPDQEAHLRDLARRASLTATAMQRELANLTATDLVLSRRDGNRLYFRANSAHPLYSEIHGLVLKTTGLAAQLSTVFATLPNVNLAFIFGSVAAGTSTPASDVDVMVIGSIGLRQLTPFIRKTALQLSREVNSYCLTSTEWLEKKMRGDVFISRVIAEPKIWLKGGVDDLTNLG